jgi:membrane-bound lytic murein transglycosylase D
VTIPDEGSASQPALALMLAAGVAAFATVGLTRAGAGDPATPEVTAAEPVEPMPAVAVPGVVPAGHPVLPPRFAGLEDEILASPMLYHPPFAAEVEEWVQRWSTSLARRMPTYLERMTSFEQMVDETLAERALPGSLRYLPVIESGYSPSAVSSASAVGMWQFMAPTARELGVEVTRLVDDRRDPFVSTEAAAEYLTELHRRYDSWFLALAAYNAGPDRIDGLIRRYLPDVEPSDAVYWALRNVLPEETAAFVPNFLGAAIVASAPTEYGYSEPPTVPFAFEPVPVVGAVSFAEVARAAGSSTDEIARLNPEYLRRVTPPDRQVELRLPPGTSAAFRSYFSQTADR